MTKRRNPYFDDFEPQIKIHVGLKQLNNNNDEKMKNVYDKTINMLFEAANSKNVAIKNNIESYNVKHNLQHSQINQDQPLHEKKLLKQTFFGKNGTLKKTGFLLPMEARECHPCGVCASQPADPWEACSQCETPQCSACSVTCIQCSNLTCSNCSFPCYNSIGSVVCVSCSR